MLLKVTTEFWTATSVWRSADGVWFCTQADPKLQWMFHKTTAEVHRQLLLLDARWQWSPELPLSHSANSANRTQPTSGAGPARMNVAQSKSSPLSESTKGRSETNMRKNNLNTLAGGEGESGGSRKRSAFDSDDTAALSLQTGCELTPNGCLPDARISTAVGLTARASI